MQMQQAACYYTAAGPLPCAYLDGQAQQQSNSLEVWQTSGANQGCHTGWQQQGPTDVLSQQSCATNYMHGQTSVQGNVWNLSRTQKGSRAVQQALDEADDELRAAIANELHGHTWEALRCPHANYALQKCISTMKPHAVQFVVDDLNGRAVEAACHRFGCRVLERLLEHCPAEQVRGLTDEVIANIAKTSRHAYGNYVVQHMLEYGSQDQKDRIVLSMEQDVVAMVSDKHACAVVSKVLCSGEIKARKGLAKAILNVPGLIVSMACDRHGHTAAVRILEIMEGSWQDQARMQLNRATAQMRGTRYGRLVFAQLQQRLATTGMPAVGGG
jgi:hypothetical protein